MKIRSLKWAEEGGWYTVDREGPPDFEPGEGFQQVAKGVFAAIIPSVILGVMSDEALAAAEAAGML